MATSLVQMAYNLTDMIWIGRIGSNAVASVGAAGMYMWFANGIAVLAKMGGQVKVGHALGAGEQEQARGYARNAIQLSLFFGLFYGIICLLVQGSVDRILPSEFQNRNPGCRSISRHHLRTGHIFLFEPGIYRNSDCHGQQSGPRFSRQQSDLSSISSLTYPDFWNWAISTDVVAGAAIATVFAQSVVTAVFLVSIRREPDIFMNLHFFTRPQTDILKELIQIGLPSSIQNMMFTGISMVIARMVASFGDAAVAVQKVGSQIESISWMTSDGFAAAVNSFIK